MYLHFTQASVTMYVMVKAIGSQLDQSGDAAVIMAGFGAVGLKGQVSRYSRVIAFCRMHKRHERFKRMISLAGPQSGALHCVT
jgi:hypothetical protein